MPQTSASGLSLRPKPQASGFRPQPQASASGLKHHDEYAGYYEGDDDGDAEDDYAGDVCVSMGAEPERCQALDRT